MGSRPFVRVEGREVSFVKQRLIRIAYSVGTLAALLMVLGAGRKWPKP